MRSLLSVLLCCVSVLAISTACTPKSAQPEPAAEQFLTAVAQQDWDALSGLVDDAEAAQQELSTTWEGLQAESLDAKVVEVENTSENAATVTYSVAWHLPREREFQYESSMVLNRQGDEWVVRWRPTIIYPTLGTNQNLELRTVSAQRASVVSSDGVAVLTPGTQRRVLIDTTAIADAGLTARRISAALEEAHDREETSPTVSAANIQAGIQDAQGGTYSVVVLSDTQGSVVADALADLPGVTVNEEAAMVTPDSSFAPDIMSRVRTIVEDDLDGSDGWRISVVTPEGVALEDVEYHDAEVAPAVGVSIDYNVQRAAQEAVNLQSGSQAMMVAIRPSTGEILAVAQTEEADAEGDVALMGQYPPGSTFKMITAAAGMEHEGLSPDSTVACPGTMNLYGRVVTNYNSFSLGNVPLETAFARSCNTTFASIATDLQPGELQEEAKSFGIGVDYEIPGLDTLTGSVPVGDEALDRTEAGYGQGADLVSPFGMALVAATAASGRTPTPTLISGHETTVSETPAAPTEEAIAGLQRMMRAVVTSGTATGMSASGDIRGKTGEAEINDGSHAWFAGYRDDDIAFATLVVLGGGSEVSVAITDHFFQRLDELRGSTS